MKLESLVIADQHAAVNTLTGLVHTARQVLEIGQTLNGFLFRQPRGARPRIAPPGLERDFYHGLVDNWN